MTAGPEALKFQLRPADIHKHASCIAPVFALLIEILIAQVVACDAILSAMKAPVGVASSRDHRGKMPRPQRKNQTSVAAKF
jgi:hypothetical protein